MENATTTLLPGFTVGTDAYMSVPEVVGRDVRAVVIGGEKSTRAFKARLTPEVKGLIAGFAWYGGDSNMENVEALMAGDVVTGPTLSLASVADVPSTRQRLLLISCESLSMPFQPWRRTAPHPLPLQLSTMQMARSATTIIRRRRLPTCSLTRRWWPNRPTICYGRVLAMRFPRSSRCAWRRVACSSITTPCWGWRFPLRSVNP